ncbi:site-specific integrase [Microscilla marina]|uniref:Transposase, putative n=1 Tax=Microscilla marina ATCC 23134 TaxID=313606 RepID=A1ZID7_MICM2|nr:site-specific integrase [Microscilla marina]EAY29805.1 transposase, putative [Microscilla marina ATCC 23134]
MGLSIGFLLRKDKTNKKGETPVFCRISYQGKRVDFQTEVKIPMDRWLPPVVKLEKNGDQIFIKGTSEVIKSMNRLLNKMRGRILNAYTDLLNEEEEVRLQKLKAVAKGEEEKGITFLEVLTRSANRSGLRSGTQRKIKISIQNLKLFLRDEYGKEDIYLTDLLKEAYKGFDIRYVGWCTTKTTIRFDGSTRLPKKHQTAIKEVRHFRQAVNTAVQLGEIRTNPLIAKFKIPKDERPKRVILTLDELKQIMEVDLSDKRGMERVRDCFVFQCFTGFAFSDIVDLKPEHLIEQGERTWIIKERVKSSTIAKMPLLPQARFILDKYKDDPVCLSKGVLIPVITSGNYNTYLKMIAEYVGIDKHLTSHVGRRTFATLVYNAGTDRSKLKEMTGHTNEAITEIYASLANETIAKEMDKFEGLFTD